MPTVLTILGLRVTIYPNDHRPAHVHVIGKGHEAVFQLRCPDGPPGLQENYGFARNDVRKIANELTVRLAMLCNQWRQLHDY